MLMLSLAAITVSGATKLTEAVESGDLLGVLRLLAQRVDVNEKNVKSGWAPLHVAATSGNVDVLRALLKVPGVDINIRIGNFNSGGLYRGQTALLRAAYTANADAVDLLLSQPDIDIDRQTFDGDTALGWAYANGPLGLRIQNALKARGAVCRCMSSACRTSAKGC